MKTYSLEQLTKLSNSYYANARVVLLFDQNTSHF